MSRRVLRALVLLCLVSPTVTWAGDRSKQLKFEDEVIEGVGKQSAESLTQMSEEDDRKMTIHLYQKRSQYHEEIAESLHELGEEK